MILLCKYLKSVILMHGYISTYVRYKYIVCVDRSLLNAIFIDMVITSVHKNVFFTSSSCMACSLFFKLKILLFLFVLGSEPFIFIFVLHIFLFRTHVFGSNDCKIKYIHSYACVLECKSKKERNKNKIRNTRKESKNMIGLGIIIKILRDTWINYLLKTSFWCGPHVCHVYFRRWNKNKTMKPATTTTKSRKEHGYWKIFMPSISYFTQSSYKMSFFAVVGFFFFFYIPFHLFFFQRCLLLVDPLGDNKNSNICIYT